VATADAFSVTVTDSATPANTVTVPLTITVVATQSALTIVSTYRVQIYDTRKALRMADRGVRVANLGGNTQGANWFRDPYVFNVVDPQVLLIVQNLTQFQQEIQVALYGMVLRFNQLEGSM
jgi:hypothetical protein